jgi:hypothetical protein
MTDGESPKRRESPADLTMRHQAEVVGTTDNGEVYFDGTLEVEYEPNRYVLSESEVEALTALETGTTHPEQYVVDIYKSIVDAIYPGYDDRDEPWSVCPMVVTLRYKENPARLSGEPNVENTATLGSLL